MSFDPASLSSGSAVEDVVEKLCSSSFFPDFVVRSPKYRKSSGLEKEAADVLAVFGTDLLVIQVKSRFLPAGAGESFSPVEEARFVRVAAKALEQFRALLEAWNDPQFGTFVSGRGLPVTFKRGRPTRLILLVVYAILMPDGSQPKFTLRCSNSCAAEGPVPIHIFSLTEFATLVRMLDTFPDFMTYLETRANLHALKLVAPASDPLDVWALVTFERKRLLAAVSDETPLEITGLHLQHQDSVADLEQREQISYFVDWLIHELHAGSGRTLVVHPDLERMGNLEEIPGSMAAYQRVVPYLAQLKRVERTRLAEELFIRVQRSQDGNDSFGGMKLETHAEAYLVLSRVGPRATRHLALRNLGLGLAQRLKVERVICIATGPAGPAQAGCDVMIVETDPSQPSTKIEAAANEWFGPAQETQHPS